MIRGSMTLSSVSGASGAGLLRPTSMKDDRGCRPFQQCVVTPLVQCKCKCAPSFSASLLVRMNCGGGCLKFAGVPDCGISSMTSSHSTPSPVFGAFTTGLSIA